LEIIPLYATSLLIVLFEVFALCRPGGIMNMDTGGYKYNQITEVISEKYFLTDSTPMSHIYCRSNE